MYYKFVFWLPVFSFFLLCTVSLQAQVVSQLYETDYRINPGHVGSLFVEVDNMSFFKDNEFAGEVMKGYSLPGLWLQPKAVYYPLKNIKLELGLHALIYSGAYKYPTSAYQDIATWKGNQYQKGAHLLPFFRVQFALRKVNLVVGNLYGGTLHGLVTPLYHQELDLTADPEMGFQLLYDTRAFHLDAWINWQSYIFELDSHQEAFTVGFSSQIDYTAPEARLHVYTPLQGIIQHRGGEQDTIYTNSVQTLMNGAAGVGMTWDARGRVLRRLNLEADALFYYQQAGQLWALDDGIAFYAAACVDLKDFRVKAGYFYGNDFISLYGIPYFSALSTKNEGAFFDSPQTVFMSASWSRSFGKHYAVGAEVELFQSLPTTMMEEGGMQSELESATSFSFGVYFRINPSFFIKKWAEKKR